MDSSKPLTRGEFHSELKQLKARMATKADLDDLRMTTKADLDDLRTTTKADLARVAKAVVDNQSKLRDIEERMSTKADVARVLQAVEQVLAKGEAYDRKSLSHGAILQDHEATLRSHERRLSALESFRSK